MRRFRAYFNRKSEAPQVWSIDDGSQESEINVIEFVTHPGVTIRSRYNHEKPNNDSPSAWVEVHADYYFISGGIVHFSMHPADGRP